MDRKKYVIEEKGEEQLPNAAPSFPEVDEDTMGFPKDLDFRKNLGCGG